MPAVVRTAVEAGLEHELRGLEGLALTTASEVSALLGAERSRQLLGLSSDQRPGGPLPGLEEHEWVRVEVHSEAAGYRVEARRVPAAGAPGPARAERVTGDARALAEGAARLVAQLFPGLARRPATARPKSEAPRPIRVAVFDVRTTGDVPPRALAALSQALTPELRKLEGVSAISAAELSDMLGFERQRQLAGCAQEQSACMAELAGALDADEFVVLELTLVGESYALAARRTDMRAAKVVQSLLKQLSKRDGEELLAVIGPCVEGLYPERGLKPGRARGVEPEVMRRLNPPPLPRWAFAATVAAAGVALGTGAGFGLSAVEAQGAFGALAQRSSSFLVSSAELNLLAARAQSNAAVANALFAAGGALVLAAVVELFFTDWRGDRGTLAGGPQAVGLSQVGPGFWLAPHLSR